MTEKEIIYHIFLDLWDISKRYLFIPLNDLLWDELIDENAKNTMKYKQYGEAVCELYKKISAAIITYKEHRDKGNGGK